MTDRSEENVPRGDHVPGGAQPNDDMKGKSAERAGPGTDGAPHRGHGAQGGGPPGREEHEDPATPTPDAAKGSDHGGSSGFDGSRAGGSVTDTRGPKEE